MVLVPVVRGGRTGLLVVRRGIEPGKGKLALVGGFVEEEETWQVGGAREVHEEANVKVDASAVTPFWFTSTEPRPNRVLLFGLAEPVPSESLASFAANAETLARGLVFGPVGLDDVFAFPLHAAAAKRYFASRDVHGAHELTEA